MEASFVKYVYILYFGNMCIIVYWPCFALWMYIICKSIKIDQRLGLTSPSSRMANSLRFLTLCIVHTVRISCLIGFQIRLYFFDQIPNDRDIRNNGNGLFQNNSNWRLMHQSAFQKRCLDRPILRLM